MYFSCCPTVVASNLNEPYQPQSAPENYVWRYVKYTIPSGGECPDDVFKDGETGLQGTPEYNSPIVLSSPWWQKISIVAICCIIIVIITLWRHLRRKYDHLLGIDVMMTKNGSDGGAYEMVMDNGFEGVDNVSAVWSRPAF